MGDRRRPVTRLRTASALTVAQTPTARPGLNVLMECASPVPPWHPLPPLPSLLPPPRAQMSAALTKTVHLVKSARTAPAVNPAPPTLIARDGARSATTPS